MAAFTNYIENQLINHLFRTASFVKPAAIYVGLMTAVTDGEAGVVTEVTAGAYARIQHNAGDANWTAAIGGNGTTSNATAITFGSVTVDFGLVTHFGIWDAPVAGNLLVYAPLGSPRNITVGSVPSFPAGTLTVQVDN